MYAEFDTVQKFELWTLMTTLEPAYASPTSGYYNVIQGNNITMSKLMVYAFYTLDWGFICKISEVLKFISYN